MGIFISIALHWTFLKSRIIKICHRDVVTMGWVSNSRSPRPLDIRSWDLNATQINHWSESRSSPSFLAHLVWECGQVPRDIYTQHLRDIILWMMFYDYIWNTADKSGTPRFGLKLFDQIYENLKNDHIWTKSCNWRPHLKLTHSNSCSL